jgi:hypothetical protein
MNFAELFCKRGSKHHTSGLVILCMATPLRHCILKGLHVLTIGHPQRLGTFEAQQIALR